MILKLSCPSKTFLIGEYAALEGGPALILNTLPRFEFTLQKTGRTQIDIFHPKSPAGLWIRERAPLLEGWELSFLDPHKGRGGLGASSAQFLLSHCATTFLQISAAKAREGFDLKALWNDYVVLAKSASGYDVLSQAVGQVAHVETNNWIVQGLSWPFANLHFVIVRTGSKTPTHQHLNEVKSEQYKGLADISREACQAFENKNEDQFIELSKNYTRALIERGLQSQKTLDCVADLEKALPLKLARGCGAMGADTLLIVFEQEYREKVIEVLKVKALEIVGESQDLAVGLETEWSWDKA